MTNSVEPPFQLVGSSTEFVIAVENSQKNSDKFCPLISCSHTEHTLRLSIRYTYTSVGMLTH